MTDKFDKLITFEELEELLDETQHIIESRKATRKRSTDERVRCVECGNRNAAYLDGDWLCGNCVRFARCVECGKRKAAFRDADGDWLCADCAHCAECGKRKAAFRDTISEWLCDDCHFNYWEW